jgi:hypothetical protein
VKPFEDAIFHDVIQTLAHAAGCELVVGSQ